MFKLRSNSIELCLILYWHDQWFKSYKDRKWLRNFTFCVSAVIKRYLVLLSAILAPLERKVSVVLLYILEQMLSIETTKPYSMNLHRKLSSMALNKIQQGFRIDPLQ